MHVAGVPAAGHDRQVVVVQSHAWRVVGWHEQAGSVRVEEPHADGRAVVARREATIRRYQRHRSGVWCADLAPHCRAVVGPRWKGPGRVILMDLLAFGPTIRGERTGRAQHQQQHTQAEGNPHSFTYGMVCGPCGSTASRASGPAAVS